jgi:hypothetical protein
MYKEKVIISFDLSTTVAGICIQNFKSKEILKLSYHNFENKIMIDKSIELENLVEEVFSDYQNVECFVIEERLKAFAAGGTNAEAKCNSFIFKDKNLNGLQKNICGVN